MCRLLKIWAVIDRPYSSDIASASRFAAERLQCEIFVFHRRVVLQLVDLQDSVAVSFQVMHVDVMRSPNTLIISNVGVMRAPNQSRLVVILDLCQRVIVFADP